MTEHTVKFSFYRLSLAIYNLVVGWIVLRSLLPFPEEPIRVNSFGFVTLLGLVLLAFFALRTPNRIFVWCVPIIWAMAGWHLYQFTGKLELMLLETKVPWTCIATLPFVYLYMLIHRTTWREFKKKIREYPVHRPRFLKSGFHF